MWKRVRGSVCVSMHACVKDREREKERESEREREREREREYIMIIYEEKTNPWSCNGNIIKAISAIARALAFVCEYKL